MNQAAHPQHVTSLRHLFAPPVSLSVIAARMTGDFLSSIQDANHRIGGDQREWAAQLLRWKGIIVAIKADENGFLRANDNHVIGVEGMQGER